MTIDELMARILTIDDPIEFAAWTRTFTDTNSLQDLDNYDEEG